MAKKASSQSSASAGKAAKKTSRKAAVKKTAKQSAGNLQAEAPAEAPAGDKPTRTGGKKSGLGKAALGKFRQMLLDKRRDLIGDMSGIAAETLGSRKNAAGELSNMPTHMADLGTDNFEHEFSLGLLESERALLCEIDEALERFEEGTYGICLGTGKPIATARLQARPWAKYCIEYARMIEQGLVRPGQEDEELDQ